MGTVRLGGASAAVLVALAAMPAAGGVILSEKDALARAFPGQEAKRRVLYLRPEQVRAVEKSARSKLPSAVVTAFEAWNGTKCTGRAYLDTHVVRTMPETVLTVLEPDGTLRMVLVLAFHEPTDYLPRERWLETLKGRALDDELWPGRGVRRVTGATLSAQAMTEAVRRAMALDALVVRRAP